LSLLM